MTLKTIEQNHVKVMNLPIMPSSLKFANALIDQAFMNFNYETMKATEQRKALKLLGEMIDHFNIIRGR